MGNEEKINLNKEVWNIIGNFEYNDEIYVMVINEECRKFYFKVNGNDYDYLTLDEYLQILKNFNSLKIIKGETKNHIVKNSLIKIKDKLVSSILIGVMVLSLTGCSNINNIPDAIQTLQKDGIVVVCISNENNIYTMESINFDNMNQNKSCGLSFDSYSKTPFVKICPPSELSKYTKSENITWDDINEVILNNSNISSSVKKILMDGAKNLKDYDFSMDLSAIFYNLSNLTIEYKSAKEMNGNAGYFDHTTCKATLSADINEYDVHAKEIIIHEIFGHGMTRAYIKEGGGIMCDVMNPYFKFEDTGSINSVGNLGYFAMEGIADIITSIATGNKLSHSKGSYTIEAYELCTLCSSLGIKVEEYANNGIKYLINKMIENEINNPYNLIVTLDSQMELFAMDSKCNINNTELFINYYAELIKNGRIEYVEDSLEEYSKFINTEKIGDLNIIIRTKNGNDFIMLQPDEITEMVKSNIGYKK